MTFRHHFSKDIYQARKQLGLTQQQVSEKMNMSLRGYQKIEKGEVRPTTEHFIRLVLIFHIQVEDYREDVF